MNKKFNDFFLFENVIGKQNYINKYIKQYKKKI
jgi:hypothetical protein